MKVNSFSLSEVGKVRKANEDAYSNAVTPNGTVFVVCDGMGGHVGGATASTLAAKSIIEYFEKEVYDNVILAIDKAFQFANEQIFAFAQAEPTLQGMGTTAAVLVIKGDDCYIGHVGDSRIYLKTDSVLHRLTKDHSYVQGLVDSGVITDDEAETHPKRNQILKALGHSLEVQGTVSATPIRVKAGDVFLLCSDGLNGMIPDDFISKSIDFNDLTESGGRLYEGAMDNRGADNITVVLVGVIESNHTGNSVFVSCNPRSNHATMSFGDKDDRFSTTSNFKPKKKNSKLQALILTLGLFISIGGGYAVYTTYFKQPPVGTTSGEDTSTLTEEDLDGKTVEQLKKYKGRKTNFDDTDIVVSKEGKQVKVTIKVDNFVVIDIVEKPTVLSNEIAGGTPAKKDEPQKTTPVPLQNGGKSLTLPEPMNINQIKAIISKNNSNKCNLVSDKELIELNEAGVNNLKDKAVKERVIKSGVYPKNFKFQYNCVEKNNINNTVNNNSPSDLIKEIELKDPTPISLIRTLIRNCNVVSDEELKKLNEASVNNLKDKEVKERVIQSGLYPKNFKFKYRCN